MNPYTEKMQIEEVVNSDFFEDLLSDPYFDEDEEYLYDDSSLGSMDLSNDF
jgi:hypothetical protein